MRRTMYVVALLLVGLLALCALVLGFVLWQNQNAILKSIEDLKMEVGTRPPTPSSNPPTPQTPTPTNPPTGSTEPACIAEGELFDAELPGLNCCVGLTETPLDLVDMTAAVNAKCI